MVISVRKEFNWAMSHLLENHLGLCKNIHGHNYKLIVEFTGNLIKVKDSESKAGMVDDFKNIKELVNFNIVDKFDHAFVYNSTNKQSIEIAIFLKEKLNQKTLKLPFRTTAENMSQWIKDELNKLIKYLKDVPGAEKVNYKCTKVILYETETSCAIAK